MNLQGQPLRGQHRLVGSLRRSLLFAVLCICISTLGVAQAAAAPKTIVLIAGRKSHGPGEHEYLKSVKLLKVLLDRAPDLHGIRTEVYFDGWPADPRVLERADTIAFFSDGEHPSVGFHAPFMTNERMAVLARQMKRGCGFLTFHFSTFSSQTYAPQILAWTGGYFDWQGGHGEGGNFGVKNEGERLQWHSKIRWLKADVTLPNPDHPIARGVAPFGLLDEFYYQIRFADPKARRGGQWIPMIRVPELSPDPDDATVAWALERSNGGRSFATTTGHVFANWRNDSYRKLILNALVWTARGRVPAGGVTSHYIDETAVDQAIAVEQRDSR